MIRYFTERAVGETYGSNRRKVCPFECIQQWTGLKLPFPFVWQDKTLRMHILHTVEIYAPIDELKNPTCFKLWVGYSFDDKMLFIPEDRRQQLLELIRKGFS